MQAICTEEMIEIEEFVGRGREVKAEPRGNRIRMVRRRLAEGWYDRDDLLDAILERILVDLSIA
ncbi:MAG: hypothetical protein KBE65_20525 [Phycisphaerae bacterium]|nr:hypothetical protein [Phycisphaerae bacterium]